MGRSLKFFCLIVLLVSMVPSFTEAGVCVNRCTNVNFPCRCPTGCTEGTNSPCGGGTPLNNDPCTLVNMNAGPFSCWINYYTPEFAPIPGFLTFLSSLGIPYWLYRRNKKK